MLEKLAGFKKADYLYATPFSLICVQFVTYSEADTDDNLQERTAFISPVSVFDNLQMNFPFKFQRGSKTSNDLWVTSCLYINVWQGTWQKKKQLFDRVPIMYCDQAIPSPFFMPPFEHSVPSCKMMGCIQYPHIVTTEDAGLTPVEVLDALQQQFEPLWNQQLVVVDDGTGKKFK
jgi:hypothetical protein